MQLFYKYDNASGAIDLQNVNNFVTVETLTRLDLIDKMFVEVKTTIRKEFIL